MLTCIGRDLVEEWLAADIWPLSPGWRPRRIENKPVPGFEKFVDLPIFSFGKIKDTDQANYVQEIESRALEILGPYGAKEVNSTIKHFGKVIRIIRVLFEKGISVGRRIRGSKPVTRMTPPGNVGSDAPSKKRKRTLTWTCPSQSRPPITKNLEKEKKKTGHFDKNKKESGSSKRSKIRTLLNTNLFKSPAGSSDGEQLLVKAAAAQLLEIAKISEAEKGSENFMKDLPETPSAAGGGLFIPQFIAL